MREPDKYYMPKSAGRYDSYIYLATFFIAHRKMENKRMHWD